MEAFHNLLHVKKLVPLNNDYAHELKIHPVPIWHVICEKENRGDNYLEDTSVSA